ncbi:MAG: hypothetical protein C4523_08435 [Myxococcales bacterium]|nr:MAG: hypothetical protein C4523_08435 [Myxococcales bacterium]
MRGRDLLAWGCVAALALLIMACAESSATPDGDGEQSDGDAEENLEADAEEEEAPNPLCDYTNVPQDEPDLSLTKFALSMFHFNVQYVAGGLEAEIDGQTEGMCGPPCLGWTDDRLADWIVVQCVEPVLDFYLAHPTWKTTFEMQALMLEVIAARHPAVLEKLRDAAQRGQVELVSFHYSAQLFLAFPALDLRRSIERTKRVFEENCAPLSPVVFNQEGQDGEGKHAFMAEHGYSIDVFPKNLYGYVRQGETRWPYYASHGVDVVIGPGEVDPAGGVEVNWTFFDDGELLTVPADPYFAFAVEADLERLVEYEAELAALEESGYKITTIADYVAHLKARGVEQKPLPPVIDGSWQPGSTDSVLRWLGGRSLAPYATRERDNRIRTENYRIRTDLQAAEIIVAEAQAQSHDTADLDESLLEAWRHLSLAEVSDATGITPWPGEFLYALNHNAEAQRLADEATEAAKALLGWPYARIDLSEAAATQLDDPPQPESPQPVDAPIVATAHAERETSMEWHAIGDNAWELIFSYGPGPDPTGVDAEATKVALDFPRTEDVLRYSPALLDDELVEMDFAAYAFDKPEIYLPLANGLIGLGDGWWVIKDCRSVHLAARVPNTPEEPIVQFIDETADPVEPQTWRFVVVNGAAVEALAWAKQVNTAPVVIR